MEKHPLRTPKLHELLLNGRKLHLSKGQVFQSSNDRQQLSLVTEGFVKRYSITSRGTLGIQSIYGKDDIFPLTPVFKLFFDQDIYHGDEVFYYEAMSTSEIFTVDNQTLKQAVDADNDLYKELFSVAGERLESNIRQLENLSLHNSHNRVAHIVYFFARRFGEKQKNGVKLNMPLTQQDLADLLGASRETISMAIGKLRDQKLLLNSRNIVISDMKRLRQEAYK
jgi:CRP/FNR family cyclic AMP-dependent transcriptional regulator